MKLCQYTKILSGRGTERNETSRVKCAIIINLFYLDSKVDWYLAYIKKISSKLDVYFISSNSRLLDYLKKNGAEYLNWNYVKKKNRGRDISALLVAARDIIEQYDYVCFLHDKHPIADYLTEDTRIWTWNLWGNMIENNDYIEEILRLFEEDKRLGMVVPPARCGQYFTDWYSDGSWGSDFENCVELARKLKINCIPRKEDKLFALGTVFWIKTVCLKKLFDMQWKYEDFPEEPMPEDGTISHAIERIFPYLVADCGYYSAVVMTEKYAQWLLDYAQNALTDMFAVLCKNEGIYSIQNLRTYESKQKEMIEYSSTKKRIYIYGCGMWGKRILHFLNSCDIMPEAFVVSKNNVENHRVEGLKVYSLGDINFNKDDGVIIATAIKLQKDIIDSLEEKGFSDYVIGVG